MPRPSCSPMKAFELGDEGSRLLDLRQMPAFGDDRPPSSPGSAADRRRRSPCGNSRSLVAPDQQRRHVDPVQPFVQVRDRSRAAARPAWRWSCGSSGRRPRAPAAATRAIIASAQLLIVEQVADALLVVAQEGVDLRHALDMDAGGADQRQRGEPAGVAHRKLGRDPAAERDADQMDAVEIELVEEVEIEVGEVGDGVEPVRRVGGAEARMLRARSRRTSPPAAP